MLLILCMLGVVAMHDLSGVSSMDTTESSNQIPKIVGGSSASEGQYPYQASLRFHNRHFCGGSVIDKRWILTASHCLSSFNDTAITVVLGTNTLDKGGDEYSSIKRLMHPYYNSAFIRNDIGLIKLDRDIVFGDKVKPIALPTKRFDKSDYPAILSGWGTTNGDSGGPLVADNEQIGVVSWGIPCARGRPDVFTRVSSYMNWIKQHLEEDNTV
ncbi:hypothetical protein ACFW04_000185 [Cataglyphis niger]